ncbi:phosphopantetheine-binding protein [Mycolicibacterium sp. CBM1]
MRDAVVAAVCAVLYVDASDFTDGDETDLRDLGLDSIRFVLLMKHLGVQRDSEIPLRLADVLTVAAWVPILQDVRDRA